MAGAASSGLEQCANCFLHVLLVQMRTIMPEKRKKSALPPAGSHAAAEEPAAAKRRKTSTVTVAVSEPAPPTQVWAHDAYSAVQLRRVVASSVLLSWWVAGCFAAPQRASSNERASVSPWCEEAQG